jgi:hypothetical protein
MEVGLAIVSTKLLHQAFHIVIMSFLADSLARYTLLETLKMKPMN